MPQTEEQKALWHKWLKFKCIVCGHTLTREEALLYSIFDEQCDRELCMDCSIRAHNKKHPGLTCCEAQLGHDEGCIDKGQCCGGKYAPEDEDQCDFCDSGRCQRCLDNAKRRNGRE